MRASFLKKKYGHGTAEVCRTKLYVTNVIATYVLFANIHDPHMHGRTVINVSANKHILAQA